MGCNGSKSNGAAAAVPGKAQVLEGSFQITLERTSDEQAIGLRVVDAGDSALCVEALKEEGLLPDFIKANANVPEQHVKIGDRIIAVNGVSDGVEKMKAELEKKTIVLTVKRDAQDAQAGEKAPEVAPAPASEGAVQVQPASESKRQSVVIEAAAEAPEAEKKAAETSEQNKTVEKPAENPTVSPASQVSNAAPAAEDGQAAPAAEEQKEAPAAVEAEAAPNAAVVEVAPVEAASGAENATVPLATEAPSVPQTASLMSEEAAKVEMDEAQDDVNIETAKEEKLCTLARCNMLG